MWATDPQSPTPNDGLPLERLCLLKVPQLPQTVSPTGDQVYDLGNWTVPLKSEFHYGQNRMLSGHLILTNVSICSVFFLLRVPTSQTLWWQSKYSALSQPTESCYVDVLLMGA